MPLDHVDPFNGDPSRLGVHPKNPPPLALILAGDNLHRITLGDMQPNTGGGLVADSLGFLEYQWLHATAPPAPVTRSSCTASRGSPGPPARRCGWTAARPRR